MNVEIAEGTWAFPCSLSYAFVADRLASVTSAVFVDVSDTVSVKRILMTHSVVKLEVSSHLTTNGLAKCI